MEKMYYNGVQADDYVVTDDRYDRNSMNAIDWLGKVYRFHLFDWPNWFIYNNLYYNSFILTNT